jgi:outer membrane protein TolC
MKTHARPLSAALALLLSATASLAAAEPPPPAAQPAPPPVASARVTSLDAYLASIGGQAGGLTSDEVARRAAATSFDVQARHAELEAAGAAVDQALVAFFPRLSAVARYQRLSPLDADVLGYLVGPQDQKNPPLGPLQAGTPLAVVPLSFPVLLNQTLIQASLSIPLSDYVLRISQGYAAASRSEKAAGLNEEAQKLKVALDGRVAYYTWVRARLQSFVAGRALAQARQHLVDVQHAFEAGAVSKADVLRVEAQVASAELLVQRAGGLASVSEIGVRTAMHEPAPRAYSLGEDLRSAALPAAPAADADALYDEALSRRLEIRALDQTAFSLREQAKIARASFGPRLDAIGDVTVANPNQRVIPPTDKFIATWSVGVQASWTLNDIAVGAAQAKGAEARRAQVEAQKHALADALRMEVAQAVQAVRDAEVAAGTTARALAASEESYRARRELFLNGRATSVELTDAETELTRAELEVINARVDQRLSAARLAHATGRDVSAAAQQGASASP